MPGSSRSQLVASANCGSRVRFPTSSRCTHFWAYKMCTKLSRELNHRGIAMGLPPDHGMPFDLIWEVALRHLTTEIVARIIFFFKFV